MCHMTQGSASTPQRPCIERRKAADTSSSLMCSVTPLPLNIIFIGIVIITIITHES